MRKSTEHNRQISEKLNKLSLTQVAIFFCLACDRQLPIYKKFSKGQSWGDSKALMSLLNKCWEWSISYGKIPKPPIPTANNFIKVSGGQAGSGHAAYPYYSIDDLVNYINTECRNDRNNPATNAINIIDAYLYDTVFSSVTKENDNRIDTHPLMTQEMNRQSHDIVLVSQLNWNNINWKKERKSASGRIILDLSSKKSLT